jgi:hypothetical protein
MFFVPHDGPLTVSHHQVPDVELIWHPRLLVPRIHQAVEISFAMHRVPMAAALATPQHHDAIRIRFDYCFHAVIDAHMHAFNQDIALGEFHACSHRGHSRTLCCRHRGIDRSIARACGFLAVETEAASK